MISIYQNNNSILGCQRGSFFDFEALPLTHHLVKRGSNSSIYYNV